MLFLSPALCSSTAFLSHQSDFSARVRFYSSLQAFLYAAVVDLVLLICVTLVGLVSFSHKNRWGQSSPGVFCLAGYVLIVSIGSVCIGQYPEKYSLSQVFSALILAWPVDVCSLSQVFSALILAWPVDVCSLSQVFSALILAWPVDVCSLSQVSSPLNLAWPVDVCSLSQVSSPLNFAWPVDVRSCRNC